MLNRLKKISSGELKKNIIMLDSQYKENCLNIDYLEELISTDFESFLSNFNDLSNQNDMNIKLAINPNNSKEFFIIENEEEIFKDIQKDSSDALVTQEYIPLYGKREEQIKLFVSYSHKDSQYVENIISELEKTNYPFKFWRDKDNLISGDEFKGDIHIAIEDHDLGLLMVSKNFESDFIVKHELPYFIEMKDSEISKHKCPIPICISSKNDLNNLRFIDDSIIFLNDDEGYVESMDRSAFIKNLADEINKIYERETFKKSKVVTSLCEEAKDVDEKFVITKAKGGIDIVKEIKDWSKISIVNYQHKVESLNKKVNELNERLETRRVLHSNKSETDKIQNELLKLKEQINFYSSEKYTSRFFALLGDSGMGKTWSCMKVALELFREDTILKPIYLDLRHFAASELIEKDFDWKEIIKTVLNGSLHTYKKEASIATIFEIIKSGKAFVIFDGLDEVTIHLKDDRRVNTFIKELKEIALLNKENKILFSCRTHYFRSIKEQFSVLRGQDRDSTQNKDFTSLELLPFSWEQIEEYCKKQKIKFKVFSDIIKSIHNLEEMAQRPYSLKLITLQIMKLEYLVSEGQVINSSDIYLNIIEESLNRDDGKHTLSKIHKPLIMRELASYMWKKGLKELEYPDLDVWFSNWLNDNKHISNEYNNESREKLKSDLRGATFIVRPNSNIFRFSHTSLYEFFLAWYLFESLKEGNIQNFDMNIPSKETIEFFVMLLKRDTLNSNLPQSFNNLVKYNSNFALEIYLIMDSLRYEIHLNEKFNIVSKCYSERIISGKTANPIIIKDATFIDVDFSNMTLQNIMFINVTFDKCNFLNTIIKVVVFNSSIFKSSTIRYKEKIGCTFDKISYSNCTILN